VFVCKSHHIDCLIKELGIDNSLGNLTNTSTTHTKEKILDHHRSVFCSFGISTKDEELDLPSLYWIPKLHKCPFRQRYTAGSAKCSTKPLFKVLTCILSAFGRIRVVFYQNKICPFLAQGICIYVGHSFFMKHSWTNSFNLSFSLKCRG
jgi:hypothetical protein